MRISDWSSDVCSSDLTIGEGTRIWHWAHVCSGARIGAGCSLGQNVFVANDVVIGNNVKIQNHVSVSDALRLEDDVFCGPSDRMSVGQGKRVSGRVDLGVRRILKTKHKQQPLTPQ